MCGRESMYKNPVIHHRWWNASTLLWYGCHFIVAHIDCSAPSLLHGNVIKDESWSWALIVSLADVLYRIYPIILTGGVKYLLLRLLVIGCGRLVSHEAFSSFYGSTSFPHHQSCGWISNGQPAGWIIKDVRLDLKLDGRWTRSNLGYRWFEPQTLAFTGPCWRKSEKTGFSFRRQSGQAKYHINGRSI